jgi:hypothetical protein
MDRSADGDGGALLESSVAADPPAVMTPPVAKRIYAAYIRVHE